MTDELFPLPAGWKWGTLRDVSEFVSVGFVGPTSEHFVAPGEGIRLVRSQNIRPGRLHLDDTAWISEAFHHRNRKSQLRPGDVLITRVGANAGDVCRVPENVGELHLSSAVFSRPIPAYARFVEYWLRSPLGQRSLLATIVGSVSERINTRDAERVPTPIPPAELADQIVGPLAAMDDKIALNRRMNETLEAMAQAILRDWFVDFGPVRRKLAGERDPVAVMGGFTSDTNRAAELAALFADDLDESGLPSGWSPGRAEMLIEFNPTEPLRKGTSAPYSDMSSLPTQGSVAEAPVMRDFGSGMRFRNGDALLARITPCLENGKTAFVDYLDNGQVGWGSTEFIVMRARSNVPKPLAYLLARDPDFRQHAIRSMTGTSGRQRAQTDVLEAWPMAISPSDVLKAFSDFVKPLFERITASGSENRTLAEARDYLLPRLISGKVTVAELETVEAAA